MKQYLQKKHCGGFTLIEALVTVGIFAFLTAITITNYRSVDNTLLLDALANKVAVSVRQTQISGTAVQQDIAGSFLNGYGLNFILTSNARYLSYADRNVNKKWDTGETTQTYNLSTGYTIKKLCVDQKVAAPLPCNSSSDSGWADQIDITFIRPNPEATIMGTKGAVSIPRSDADIVLQSRNGNTKTVVVWITGQISIE